MPDYVPCGWPADGHPPPKDEPASWPRDHDNSCESPASGWFASPRPQTEPIFSVCTMHAHEAARFDWSVTDGQGHLFQDRLVPRTADGQPVEPPETVQARAQRGEPDAVRRMDIYEQLAGVEDTRPCMWPRDGHTPSLTQVASYTGCGATPCRHRALSPDGHVLLLRLPVCDACADLAEAAGWTFGPLGPTSVARAEPERAIPNDVQAASDAYRDALAQRLRGVHVDLPPHPRHLAEPDASVDVMADLGDGRGLRPATIRRATPDETAAFNEAYDGVKAVRESLRPTLEADLLRRAERLAEQARQQLPTRTGSMARSIPPELADLLATTPRPLPRRGWSGLFPEGDAPRGCVAPLVAGLVLGGAVGLAAAGELAELLRRRLDAR